VTATKQPPVKISHIDWQQQVVDLLRVLGWRWMHVRRSKGHGGFWTTSTNIDGWPDLLCWSIRGKPGLVAIELKVGRDKPSAAQIKVLSELHSSGVKCWVLWPHQLDAVPGWLNNIERAPTRIGW